MIRPELEVLLQGALDGALTPDEQAQLATLIAESPEARDRAAELTQLAGLIESLGPADAPASFVDHVLKQVTPNVRHATFQRGVTVNKKILFGLAAAAAIVLAVITYYSNPPATTGTEATIGAAQRAQTPQMAPADVKLGDTSTQDVLQTETFDAIMKDETLRNMLQDAELRGRLADVEVRRALEDEGVRRALKDPSLMRRLDDENLRGSLSSVELLKKYDDANMRALLSNRAFAEALRRQEFRNFLKTPGYAAALAGDTMLRAIRDRNFDAAIRSQRFAQSLARGARVQQ